MINTWVITNNGKFMNSSDIFNIIQSIASTTKGNEKMAILKSHSDSELFKKIVYYTLNPHFVYGVIPDTSWNLKSDQYDNRDDEFSEETFKLLDDLINRNLTGHAARDAIIKHIHELNHESVELLIRIIRKDLRAGVSESTANKVWKGLIPKYPYHRCSLPSESKITDLDFKNGVYSQLKLDGLFNNANCLGGNVQCTTRQGTNIPMEKLSHIVDDLSHIDGYQLHGEFTVVENGVALPRQIGNGIINSICKGDGDVTPSQRIVYTVWDAIPLDSVTPKGTYEVAYSERLGLLERMLGDKDNVEVVEYKILYSKEDCIEHAKEIISRGLEGTVIKHPKMNWRDGKSKYQVKLKVEFVVELVINSIGEGKADTKVAGRPATLQCQSSCGLLQVNVTIKNESMRDIIEHNPDDWIGKVVSVKANDIMKPTDRKETYSLFLPRLAEDVYRIDKDEADDLETIFKQLNDSVKL